MKTSELLKILHETYSDPVTELKNWTNGIQFMVSVILSAQATDKGVNKATPTLFAKYKTAKDFASANIDDLQKLVSSINFYRVKAKRIIDACKYVEDNYGGALPKDIDKLVKIPGIGRKSANVILIEVFNEAHGIVVDTHITRVSKRWNLTKYTDQKDAEKIEEDLKREIPEKDWGFYSSAVVLHGRYICKARKPLCSECPLNKICPSAFKV